jgi:DNA-binding IclR family transcriptional regulator
MSPEPLLLLLARDRTAPASALAVLVLVQQEGLVGPDWRPLKQIALAQLSGRPQTSVSDALRWLVDRGYLERLTEPFAGKLYRLPSTTRRG